MTTDSIRLAFVGDIMLGRHIDRRLAGLTPGDLWGDLLPVFHAADAVIGNLECPITTYPHRWRRMMSRCAMFGTIPVVTPCGFEIVPPDSARAASEVPGDGMS